ncbi:MAG: TIGR00341 family protein [Gammaproteobacteria bacterium]|nr:TIGR00341 family protein [Gammaproteobacteria bacterium]MCP5136200.1 TIGR00341 family protein [Gammaproteobacteria bacterium]
MKMIEVISDPGHEDTLRGIAEQKAAVDFWACPSIEEGRQSARFLVRAEQAQELIDAVHQVTGTDERFRILVTPVEATLPKPAEHDSKAQGAPREALYMNIEKNARLDANYLILVALSTVVAAIGLMENNVAVVIGAMVIAPLLGPNLALALGSALGDISLIGRAVRTLLVGLAMAIGLSILLGNILGSSIPGALHSPELLARTVAGWDSAALALASGAAAVLSLTTGVSSVLVGVMVAVALLPPAATVGIMLGEAQYPAAMGAALLLAINIVCVNLSAKLVLLLRGIRPRTWLEQRKARQSSTIAILLWVLSLALLGLVLWLRA